MTSLDACLVTSLDARLVTSLDTCLVTSLDPRIEMSFDVCLVTSLGPRFVTSLDAGLVTCVHSQCDLNVSWYVVTIFVYFSRKTLVQWVVLLTSTLACLPA